MTSFEILLALSTLQFDPFQYCSMAKPETKRSQKRRETYWVCMPTKVDPYAR